MKHIKLKISSALLSTLLLNFSALSTTSEIEANTEQAETKKTKVEFKLTSGKQYDLCNDLVDYLKQSYSTLNEIEKTLFTAPTTLFSTPTYKPIAPNKGLRIDMQVRAYSDAGMYGFSGWLKSLTRYEKRYFKENNFLKRKLT